MSRLFPRSYWHEPPNRALSLGLDRPPSAAIWAELVSGQAQIYERSEQMSKVNHMKHIRICKPDRAQREEKNRNDMARKSLKSRDKRNGLTVTEFRAFRRTAGFKGSPLGYMEASRTLRFGTSV